jgi:TP901 family phage tail tape measure protein
MTSATAEFAKLGYDIQTASAMAESALVYTNVGDNVDVETGSQSIISTMKAFGVEAENTMSIVDKFNEVGNNFAITTKGIGDALQVSASAMAAAGNSLDETIALTTAANTIVQNPNTVGTALKTLSLRIRGVKTE